MAMRPKCDGRNLLFVLLEFAMYGHEPARVSVGSSYCFSRYYFDRSSYTPINGMTLVSKPDVPL